MSSRYQSQLFNFVHQQSRRLTEQWESTVRQLQVATTLGVGTIISQLYQWLYVGESSGNVLETKEPETRPQLPPVADTPIQNVLEIVENLALVEPSPTPTTVNLFSWLLSGWKKLVHKQPQALATEEKKVLTPHLSTVQGIATNLVNRHLVLVNPDNEIIDVLTPEQQTQITDKIIGEVANYWHSYRAFSAHKDTRQLSEIDRILTKLTSGKPENTSFLTGNREEYTLKPNGVLTLIDTAMANWESNAIILVQQHSQKILNIAQTQLNIFIYGQEQLEARGKIIEHGDSWETYALKISDVLEAGLNYFSGDRIGKKLKSRRNGVPELSDAFDSTQLPTAELTLDPWLSLGDLFGETKQNPEIASLNQNQVAVGTNAPHHEVSPEKPRLIWEFWTNRLSISHYSIHPPDSQTEIDELTQEFSQVQLRQNYGFEPEPDWIEITATLLGYEKHPLEQLLAWLDQAIFWVENLFLNIIYFWKGFFQIK